MENGNREINQSDGKLWWKNCQSINTPRFDPNQSVHINPFLHFHSTFILIFNARPDWTLDPNQSVLVKNVVKKTVQRMISYNKENENGKIQSRKRRVQHTLNTKQIFYILVVNTSNY